MISRTNHQTIGRDQISEFSLGVARGSVAANGDMTQTHVTNGPVLGVDDIVFALGGWHDGDGPLYRKLAARLRSLLEQGVIVTGSTLPPERRLAAKLAVSRNTVSAAYAELRLDGWIDAHQGSATTVTASSFSPVGAHRSSPLFATLLREHPDVVDLSVAVPDAAPIVREIAGNTSQHFKSTNAITSGHGYYPQGYPPLRERLAGILTEHGLPTDPDELLITGGAQQAISIAIRSLTRPGDTIAVEELSFPGALDAVALSGAATLALPMTPEGVDLEALERAVRTRQPRLLYVIPTFHNPTTANMSLPDRKRLASIISTYGLTTIDDMVLSDLDYLDVDNRPLAAIAPQAPIISVGSLTKVYWGGLRIGWLRANRTLVRYLTGVKASLDLGSSALSQRVAHVLLEHHRDTALWRNRQVKASLDACSDALRNHVPEWQWSAPTGGPHIWIELPDTLALPFSQRLLRNGVAVVAGPLLAARAGAGEHHIRIPLYRTPEVLVAAIEEMARVWKSTPD